ncbi:MAG: hypothetical protein NTV34_01915 [Proteobacteria bacterium]|nr:hypothetical protein [Pseudomonadota bacterium]
MDLINRRQFGSGALYTLHLANLGYIAWDRRALSAPLHEKLGAWILKLDQMASDLKGERLTQGEGLP